MKASTSDMRGRIQDVNGMEGTIICETLMKPISHQIYNYKCHT